MPKFAKRLFVFIVKWKRNKKRKSIQQQKGLPTLSAAFSYNVQSISQYFHMSKQQCKRVLQRSLGTVSFLKKNKGRYFNPQTLGK